VSRHGTTQTMFGVVCFLALGISTSLGVQWLYQKPHGSPAASQSVRKDFLSVPSAALDFGEAPASHHFQVKLPIQNIADHDIKIVDFMTHCTCTAVEPRERTIPKGQSREVTVTVDLTRGSTPADSETRAFAAAVVPQDVNRRALATWTIHGRVFQAFACSPPILRCDDNLIRGILFPSGSVAVSCLHPMDASEPLTVTCDPAYGSVRLIQGAVPGKCRLEVTPKPIATRERYGFDVTIHGRLKDSRAVTGELRVEARIVDEVAGYPEVVMSGATPVGSKAEQSLVLRSRTNTPFQVRAMKPSSPDVEVQEIRDSAHVEREYRITQAITGPGRHQAAIEFTVSGGAEGDAPRSLTVPVEASALSSIGLPQNVPIHRRSMR
jgi:hypothetical protein